MGVVVGSWRNQAAQEVLGRYHMPVVPIWNDTVPLWDFHRCGRMLLGARCPVQPRVESSGTEALQASAWAALQVQRRTGARMRPLLPSLRCTPFA